MTIDETIMFCDEKAKNIKLKTTPQTFIDIAEWLEELKALKSLENSRFMIIGKTKEEFVKEIRNKAIDDVMAKAKEIQEEQIKNLEQHPKRYGKQWAIYMNTHLGHIQVACKRLIAEQLKEGSADNE